MGYYVKPYIQALDYIWEYLFANKRERQILKYVPRYCRNCSCLGICRDENNNWKCKHGCMLK